MEHSRFHGSVKIKFWFFTVPFGFLLVTETVQGFLYTHAGVHFKEMLEVFAERIGRADDVRHSTTAGKALFFGDGSAREGNGS